MEILSKVRKTFEEMKGSYPETLYKYRKWSDVKHKRTITHRELFYSPPSWFPDPKDCKLVVNYELLSNRQKIKWTEYKLRQEDVESGRPSQSRNHYRSMAREHFKTSALSNNNKLEELKAKTEKEHDARIGVLCLTANPEIEKMWSEYSDHAQGFCIGLDSSLLFKHLGGGREVTYVSKLPKVMPEPIHSRDEQMIFQIFYKEDKWSDEEEYRTFTFRPKPMTLEERIIKLPPEVFTKIILGRKMSKKDKAELKENVPEELKSIQIIEN